MLILTGVSLNAIVGDNGIITNAQNVNIKSSLATLEEFLQEKYVENYENINEGEKGIDTLKRLYPNYFFKTSLGYIPDSNGNALYLIQKSGLPDYIKEQLVGGNGIDGTYSSYANLKDVYGVTSDLKVYYCLDGKSTMMGATEDDLDKDDPNRIVATNGINSLGGGLVGFTSKDTNNDGKLSASEIKSVQDAKIDCKNLTVSNLNDLGGFTSLKTLILKNANIDSLAGIEMCSHLYYIYFQNCTIKNYTALTGIRSQITHLIFNDINDAELSIFCSYTNGIGDEGHNDVTRDFVFLTHFAITGINTTNYLFSVATRGVMSELFYAVDGGAEKCEKLISNIQCLDKLSKLTKEKIEYMSLRNNNITSLNGIQNFKNIQLLRVERNLLANLEEIENLTNCVTIFAYNNSLTKLFTVKENNSLKYLDVSDNQITTLKGLENASNLNCLWAKNNKLGKDLELGTINNVLIDSLVSIQNKTNLNVLDLRNNESLIFPQYLSGCLGLRYLQLIGCSNMYYESFGLIRKIIDGCIKVNYPNGYEDYLVDKTSKSLTFNNRDLKESVFRSLIPIYDEDGTLINGCPNLERLEINQVNLVDDSGKRISGSNANKAFQDVLGSFSQMKYLKLSAQDKLSSITDINSLNFISENEISTLVDLYIRNTSILNIGQLDNYCDNLYNLCLWNMDDNFSFQGGQKVINQICSNQLSSYRDCVFFDLDYTAGLLIRERSLWKKLEGITEITGIYSNHRYDNVGESGLTLDLTGCSNLNYFGGYRAVWGFECLKLPASLEKLNIRYAGVGWIDLSLCTNLKNLFFNDASVSNQNCFDKTLESITKLYRNNKTNILPKLEKIEIYNTFSGNLTNLNALEYVKECNITDFRIYSAGRELNLDITGIKYLKKLEYLLLWYCNFDSFECLVPVYEMNEEQENVLIFGCPLLWSININFNNNLENIGCLSKLPVLSTVKINNARVKDIYYLKNFTSIVTLELNNNQLYLENEYTDSEGNKHAYNPLQVFNYMHSSGNLKNLCIKGNYFDNFDNLIKTGWITLQY